MTREEVLAEIAKLEVRVDALDKRLKEKSPKQVAIDTLREFQQSLVDGCLKLKRDIREIEL